MSRVRWRGPWQVRSHLTRMQEPECTCGHGRRDHASVSDWDTACMRCECAEWVRDDAGR